MNVKRLAKVSEQTYVCLDSGTFGCLEFQTIVRLHYDHYVWRQRKFDSIIMWLLTNQNGDTIIR